MAASSASIRRSESGAGKSQEGDFEAKGRDVGGHAGRGERRNRAWRSSSGGGEKKWEASTWLEPEGETAHEEKGTADGERLRRGLPGGDSAEGPPEESDSGEWERGRPVYGVSRRSVQTPTRDDHLDTGRRQAAEDTERLWSTRGGGGSADKRQPRWGEDNDPGGEETRPRSARAPDASWRGDRSTWQSDFEGDPGDPHTDSASPRQIAGAILSPQPGGGRQRDDAATPRMSATAIDQASAAGFRSMNARDVGSSGDRSGADGGRGDRDVLTREDEEELGEGGNREWCSSWDRSATSDDLKHDKYDPMRYKTTASPGSQGFGTSHTAPLAAPAATVSGSGGWNGAASSSTATARVKWAEENDHGPLERRSMPSQGQQAPSPSSLMRDVGGQSISAEEQQGGAAAAAAVARTTGARIDHGLGRGQSIEEVSYSYGTVKGSYPEDVEKGSYRDDVETEPFSNNGGGDDVRNQRPIDWSLTRSDGDGRGARVGGSYHQRHSSPSLHVELWGDEEAPPTRNDSNRSRGDASPTSIGQENGLTAERRRVVYEDGAGAREKGLRAAGGEMGDLEATTGSVPSGSGGVGVGGKVEHILRDGRRVVLFANGTQKVGLGSVYLYTYIRSVENEMQTKKVKRREKKKHFSLILPLLIVSLERCTSEVFNFMVLCPGV